MNTTAIHSGQRERSNFIETVCAFQKRAQQHNLLNAYFMNEGVKQGHHSFLTIHAQQQIRAGGIPDLEGLCYRLYHTFISGNSPSSALRFIPILSEHLSVAESDWERFLANPKTSHVLVQNAFMKVVLSHWRPGQESSIQSLDEGGCLFKVLKGAIIEKRYASDESRRLLSSAELNAGSISYIDDRIAYHVVGNPFQESAISLHVHCACT